MNKPFIKLLLAVWLCLPLSLSAQRLKKIDYPLPNWQNLDLQADGNFGMSTEKAYKELLQGKPHVPVVVAVIDGGIDVNHEDLKNEIWTNSKEIPGNKLDDDQNGYPDDVHGWNFIGSDKGSLQYDNLELTRILRRDMVEYKYADTRYFTPEQMAKYKKYQQLDDVLNDKIKKAQKTSEELGKFLPYMQSLLRSVGKQDPTYVDMLRYYPENEVQAALKKIVLLNWRSGTFDEFRRDEIDEPFQYAQDELKYHLNIDFDPRDSVGDNYTDDTQRFYGNNNVGGPGDEHGTHVAGIIGAQRDNNLGVKGVADDVQIMSVRTVPNGDERDKDVANAIRYAAENGAKVINMSFGKDYSWDKKTVDAAVKFAMSKDVLLVHAAGNDHKNTDETTFYPNPRYEDGSGKADAWIEVGASSFRDNNELAADFSNYGKTTVDVFAPGVKIYSTSPDSKYRVHDGTSMAAPSVAGVAALIRSYYPKLTAVQVKEIIMKTVTRVNHDVKVKVSEKSTKNIPFADTCVSGGIVNAYEALKLAATY